MEQTLLLVEDDDTIAQLVQQQLREAGFAVHREADGLLAMAAIKARRYDLVLLDLMLPGADGWEVCRFLHAHHSQVPLIIVSARSAEAHRVLGLELGADDYLTKPFSVLELVARVRALLRRVDQLRQPLNADGAQAELRLGSIRPPSASCGPVGRCASRPASSPCSNCWLAIRARCSAAPTCSTASGAAASTATSTRSTPTSTGCAARFKAMPASPG